jgi:hypothetical protein
MSFWAKAVSSPWRNDSECDRAVYAGKDYYIGIALCNLAGVYVDRKDYFGAEKLFRDALQIYSQTLPTGQLNVGIARVRLGRALLLEKRYQDAEAESRGGYEILAKQSSAPERWMQNARTDLAREYEVLHQPEKAAYLPPQYPACEQLFTRNPGTRRSASYRASAVEIKLTHYPVLE